MFQTNLTLRPPVALVCADVCQRIKYACSCLKCSFVLCRKSELISQPLKWLEAMWRENSKVNRTGLFFSASDM